MNEDCVKLTTYFGERKRYGDRLISAALLDLYERHGIASSILVRGMAGFGLRHHLRTDSLLSLSEDLPAVAVAVDARARIEAVRAEAAAISGGGLVTLERARMLTGTLSSLPLPEQLNEATKLTVYLGRQERVDGQPAFAALCDLLYRRGVAGASAVLGVDGTAHGRREQARFFSRNTEVPVMVMAVGAGERIAEVLPELGALLQRPLATLERVRVCKRDGRLLDRPHPLPGSDEQGLAQWQKLTVIASESALHRGRPVHRTIVGRLRRARASGATTVRGLWGFHGDHAPHGDRLLQWGRHVPTITTVIDTPERITEWFAVVDEVTDEHGLVTSEVVPALRVGGGADGGLRLPRPGP